MIKIAQLFNLQLKISIKSNLEYGWFNSMHHGVDIVSNLLLNMKKPQEDLKQLLILLLLMPQMKKSMLLFKDIQLSNYMLMVKLLTIVGKELPMELLILCLKNLRKYLLKIILDCQ